MEKIEVLPLVIKGKIGYDVRVNSEQATVQDYIDAVCHFIEHSGCFRSRSPNLQTCMGCDTCCQERIPVTLVDAVRLSDAELASVLGKDLHVFVEDRVVDITMGLDEAGRCRRLDPDTKLCRNYTNRPLVCRTYICCPTSQRAGQLREEIVNSGEDELVRSWFKTAGKSGALIIHEAVSPQPDIRDYERTPFSGAVDYGKVFLRDICTRLLWSKLTSRTR